MTSKINAPDPFSSLGPFEEDSYRFNTHLIWVLFGIVIVTIIADVWLKHKMEKLKIERETKLLKINRDYEIRIAEIESSLLIDRERE